MKKQYLLLISCLLFLIALSVKAEICPDPNSGPLKSGIIPEPWVVNPFSANRPQADKNTRFYRANILVVLFGRGVVCTYQNSIGYYSIWWPVNVAMPPRFNQRWRNDQAGFECTSSLNECEFYPASD